MSSWEIKVFRCFNDRQICLKSLRRLKVRQLFWQSHPSRHTTLHQRCFNSINIGATLMQCWVPGGLLPCRFIECTQKTLSSWHLNIHSKQFWGLYCRIFSINTIHSSEIWYMKSCKRVKQFPYYNHIFDQFRI